MHHYRLFLSIVICCTTSIKVWAAPPTQWPLIQAGDITYQGAFRIGAGWGETDPNDRLGFGGWALGYDVQTDALFFGGHDWYRQLCQISIPAPSKAATYNELPLASLRQLCTDVTEGTLSSVKADAKLGGTLVYNNRLIVSAYSYYDADCTQKVTHAVSSSTDLTVKGDFSGFFAMNAIPKAAVRSLAGYMGVIPEAWRELFGGPALTGMGGLPIISCASSGPAAAVFNPDDVGKTDPIPATYLLVQPNPEGPLAKELFFWTNSTSVRGVAFPDRTRSVLFIGTRGDTQCYGVGTKDRSLDRKPVPDAPSVMYCYDECGSDKGVHSYPYSQYVWAYDANDLLKVKAGQVQPWDVRPYGIWKLTESDPSGCARLRGAAFDHLHNRLFVTPEFGEQPRVDVYTIRTAPLKAPAAPRNLREKGVGSN